MSTCASTSPEPGRSGRSEQPGQPAAGASAAAEAACRSHLPGHRMPRLLAELVRRTPWGWRRGTVTSVSPDGWILLDCAEDALGTAGQTGAGTGPVRVGRAPVHAWHHLDLSGRLVPGTAVRLHQRATRHPDAPLGVGAAALAGPPGVLPGLVSLHVAQGPPPLPDPVDLEAWADPADAVVIDLRTREPLVPLR
ncbi:hypothetical protein FHN55_17255 [Streptomyces sp. NP160]|uniref:hypothetical protein n=1 Tax=Streptomyces sp. NP160 TaxID=2586637 RepID=UPI001117C42C|nr:hypothetical protein [Streptomyces sp. NP160]TNM61105.1 hypothetical protein FHN55_17255 [Streptomyces sp. NP160]